MRKLLALAFSALLAGAAYADNWVPQSSEVIAVTTTSAGSLLPGTNPAAALVCNTGAHDLYVKFGTTSPTVTTSGSWLPPSTAGTKPNCNAYALRVGNTQLTYIAVISVGGTTTAYVEVGGGVPVG